MSLRCDSCATSLIIAREVKQKLVRYKCVTALILFVLGVALNVLAVLAFGFASLEASIAVIALAPLVAIGLHTVDYFWLVPRHWKWEIHDDRPSEPMTK